MHDVAKKKSRGEYLTKKGRSGDLAKLWERNFRGGQPVVVLGWPPISVLNIWTKNPCCLTPRGTKSGCCPRWGMAYLLVTVGGVHPFAQLNG